MLMLQDYLSPSSVHLFLLIFFHILLIKVTHGQGSRMVHLSMIIVENIEINNRWSSPGRPV